jgi:hypothetical protein
VKDDKDKKAPFKRLVSSHPLFVKLCELILDPDIAYDNWFSFSEQAINTMYTLVSFPRNFTENLGVYDVQAEGPDSMCAQIVKDMASKIFNVAGGEISLKIL